MLKRITISLCVLFTVTVLIQGCASTNPKAGQVTVIQNPNGTLTTNVEPAYIPNVSGSKIVGTATDINNGFPSPYQAPIGWALGIASGVMAWLAKRKNDQAAAANDAKTQAVATTNALAASVAAQGPTVAQAVLDHASSAEATFPAVADAVNRKTLV